MQDNKVENEPEKAGRDSKDDGRKALVAEAFDPKNAAASKQGDANSPPTGYSVISPDMLDYLAKHNPKDASFEDTLNKTNELLNTPAFARPRATGAADSSREVYNADMKSKLPGRLVRSEGQPATGDEEQDKAYDFTGFVRDFYQKEYQRNSIDGKGMKLLSTVNYTENGSSFENAFWNGSQMTYGHPGASSPFKTFVLLDVAAHEITHGVTEMESNFVYYGQSGALNESMSDVFGELTEQYAKHTKAQDADWIIGNGIWKDGIRGVGLRNMLLPGSAYDDPKIGKDNQPDHMSNYLVTRRDNGGVHTNSGIPNRAFALFARSVGGFAWDDPGHIWFEARKNSGHNPSFASFAFQTIEAAKKLGHADEVEKLTKAWSDVGVTPAKDSKDTITPSKLPFPFPVKEEDDRLNKKAG